MAARLRYRYLKENHIQTQGRNALSFAPAETPPFDPVWNGGVPFSYQSPDGLTLAGREWRPGQSEPNLKKIPVLCLPGLSRNTRDFRDIAAFLQKHGHHVVALDYRGRGESAWDDDWRNYALPIEEKDIDAAIEKLGLSRFAIIGTSRGGLHALAMARRYTPELLAAVIFNDIGPHIEMRAIHRIAATLGRNMTYSSLTDVAQSLRQILGMQFPVFSETDWLKLAGQLASEHEDKVVLDYDPALAHQFASLDDAAPVPDLWPLYDAVKDRPVMIIRGSQSDLLSEETANRMVETHPNAELHTVQGQGHAPVLWEQETQEQIAGFLNRI